ncbi:MAG: hypothetical protein QMD04_10710 [Anaerolineales bacterium]|nr:hypothetical protein [Anaerolineales bacterium]
MKKFFTLFILAAVLSMGLFAAVAPISFHQTLRGMQAVAREAPGTFAYASDKLAVLMWPQSGGYGFAVINKNGVVLRDLSSFANGARVDTFTASDFVRWLEGNGYQRVDPRTLPATTALLSQFAYALANGTKAFNTFLILPLGVFEPLDINPEVLQ